MIFSKNRELASLEQHGFFDEKTIDFLNAFLVRREEFIHTGITSRGIKIRSGGKPLALFPGSWTLMQ
jgi:hypothetical protein